MRHHRANYPTLAGNLAAIMTGLIVSATISFIKPDNFDWVATRALNAENASLEAVVQVPTKNRAGPGEKGITSGSTSPNSPTYGTPDEEDSPAIQRTSSIDEILEDNPSELKSAFKVACIASFVLPFIMDFLIPIPMFLTHYIFSKGFFIAWVIISFIWVFSSAFISVMLPIWETKGFFKKLCRKIMLDMRGSRQ